jgi:hypothetical protein
LNLSGNPFCEDQNYRPYIVAHLSYLVYLDFRLIDAPSRDAALEQYKYAIEEIVHNETLAQKALEERQEDETKRKLHKVKNHTDSQQGLCLKRRIPLHLHREHFPRLHMWKIWMAASCLIAC